MRKKILLTTLASLSLATASGALLWSNRTSTLKALGSGETNEFTLTNDNLVVESIKWDSINCAYSYSLKGTSLHHGDFLSNPDDTYAYGYYGTEGYVDFSQSDNILVASSGDPYKTPGSAFIGFGFTFSGIAAINSCTYTYLDGDEEKTGFAYINGFSVYDYFSNSNGSASITLVDITIIYSC